MDGTEGSMSREEKLAWRRRAIIALLSYPSVGPLTFSAICVNLGATGAEQEVHEALSSLLSDGTLCHAGSTLLPTLEDDQSVERPEDLFTVAPGRNAT